VEEIKREIKEFFKIRETFYEFFDKNLPKDKSGFVFDFDADTKLDAKELYELFYKYDYQARKVFGTTINHFSEKK
jgi:N-acetyl-gamma-glutamylphosphate reductase